MRTAKEICDRQSIKKQKTATVPSESMERLPSEEAERIIPFPVYHLMDYDLEEPAAITPTTAPVSKSITKRRTTKHQTPTTSARGTTKQATPRTPAQAPASGYATAPSPPTAEMDRILTSVSQDKPASTPQRWEGMPPPSTHTTSTTVWIES